MVVYNGEKIVPNDCNLKEVRILNTIQNYGMLIVIDLQHKCKRWSENVVGVELDMQIGQWCSNISNELSFNKLNYSTNIETPMGFRTLTVTEARNDEMIFLEFEPVFSQLDKQLKILHAEVDTQISAIKRANSVLDVMQLGVDTISLIFPLDRVMGYRFDEDFEGEVVLEYNSVPTDVSLVGLKFPEYEIPRPARKMYSINPIRIVNDSSKDNIPVLPLDAAPFDMSRLYLRGVNSTHCMYLQRFGVVTSLSIAIHYEKQLWGMFICHTYTNPITVHSWGRFCLQKILIAVSNRITSLVKQEESVNQRHMEFLLPSQGPVILLQRDTLREICDALSCSAIFIKLGSLNRQILYTSDVYEHRSKELLRTCDINIILYNLIHEAKIKNKHIKGAITSWTEFEESTNLYRGATLIQNKDDSILLLRPEHALYFAGGDNISPTKPAFNRTRKIAAGKSQSWNSEHDKQWLQALLKCLSSDTNNLLSLTETPLPKLPVPWWKSCCRGGESVIQNPLMTVQQTDHPVLNSVSALSTTQSPNVSPSARVDSDLQHPNQHIIVCDDNDITRKMLVRLIEKINPDSKCVPLEDGLDAVKYYIDNCRTEDNQVTHMLSDRHMNFFDGDDAVSVIRQIEKKEHRKEPLIVFMLSSDRSTDVLDTNLVQKLMVKPVTVSGLKEFLAA
jgi:CheY-like chemotaxis protein